MKVRRPAHNFSAARARALGPCLLALAAAAPAKEALAATCAASAYTPLAQGRDAAMREAGELSSTGLWADARAVYLWVLARHDGDAEALYGLARLDAWEGCLGLSERGYAEILERHPADTDVRAGLVDVLLWRGRYDEAEALLDRGLALAPTSPALLARRARLAYWRGDAATALDLMDAAQRQAPRDGDIAAARSRMYRSEVRVAGRFEHWPDAYPSLYTLGAQGLHRLGRFELVGAAQVLRRIADDGTASVLDARFPLGLAYRPAIGAAVGLEIAPAVPAKAVPRLATRAYALVPVTSRIGAFLAYAYWHFDGSEQVHILNPAVGFALPRDVRLDVRGWISAIRLPADGTRPAQAEVAGAAGLALTVPVQRSIEVGAFYTYGVQLDRNPALFQVLQFESHAAGTHADIQLGGKRGLRPQLGLERRGTASGADIWVLAAELGAYARF